MMQDLTAGLVFWSVIFFIGAAFLPLSQLLFSSYKSLCYTLAKTLGILITGIFVWTLSYLGILSFNQLNIYLVFSIFVFINIILVLKKKVGFTKLDLQSFIYQEVLFLIPFLFWGYIRAHEPSIHGLEKFMDFGFINSILRTDYLPAKDVWLSPNFINYYYFGHFITAFLIKFSAVKPEVGYNLMLSALFGLCFCMSFVIGASLYSRMSHVCKTTTKQILLAGLISAFLVTLGGNLHTIYAFFQSYIPADDPVPFWTLPLRFNLEGYWYPNATRFIPFTIHEFPLYSFVVADLHGHVLDIPFVLLMIGLLVQIYHQAQTKLKEAVLAGVLISTFMMSNILDGPIYILALLVVYLKFGLINSIKNMMVAGVVSVLLFLPFYLHFVPFVSGVGVLCAPENLVSIGKLGPLIFEPGHCQRSPLWMLVILWGLPITTSLGFIFLVTRKRKEILVSDHFTLTLVIISLILILIPETIYFKDIYPLHYRANTLFKFGYQAFILFGFATAYMLVRIFTVKGNYMLYVLYVLLFSFAAIYPAFAVNSYYNGLKNYQGLDGTLYLKSLYPNDYKTVNWINQNIKGQPVILEGVGDSYSDYARVSANTGLPTVLGWPVHEWLWRGSYDVAVPRIEEVKNLYESPDLAKAQELISKYHIEYIYLGDLERQKYTSLNEEKLLKLGKVVYQSGSSKLIKI